MTSTFGGLEIAKRSLFTQQIAQQTTGQNIANANTQGYTRQTVNMVASRPLEAPGLSRSNTPGQLGQGVEFDSITRIREKFLDDQYYNENKSLGDFSTRKDTLEKIETIFNEPSDTGIRTTVANFWNAWQELSKTPDDLTARSLVKERALALTSTLNDTSKKLSDLSKDLTSNLDVQAKQADSTLTQIVNLNSEIFKIEGLGNNANDLRDQRDLLVDKLSKVMNLTVTEDQKGYVLKMGNTELVNGTTKSATIDINFFESNFGGELKSGQAYGLIQSRDSFVKSYQDDLNNLVKTIATGKTEVTLPKGTMLPSGVTLDGVDGNSYTGTLASDTKVYVNGINQLHQLGYSLDDKQGEAFFTFQDGAEAQTVTVNPDIVGDVSKIAASTGYYIDSNGNQKVLKGNNELALAIAGLKDGTFSFDNTTNATTADDFFNSIIGELGVQAQNASNQTDNQQALVNQIDTRRQSVSGVSLDEEMSNLLKFQHAYNAAARVMTTFDQMLDKVINGMGMVGR